MEDCVHRVDSVFVDEWAGAREHLAKDDAEREDVAAKVNSLAEQLLRRHVVDRSQKRSRLCFDAEERFVRAIGCERTLTTRNKFRQAEVQNLRVTVSANHEIFRFQVAVNDPRLMSFCKTFGNLYRNIQGPVDL